MLGAHVRFGGSRHRARVHCALADQDHGEGGRGLAIAGIVIGLATIVIGVVAFVVLVFAADEAVDDFEDEQRREARDVTIAECESVDGSFRAVLEVKNNSSKTSDYFIFVNFESNDGSEQLDSGTVTVSNLEPDQSTRVEVIGVAGAPEGYECEVDEVERFASSTLD